MDKSEFTARVLEAEQTMYHIAKSILHSDHDCADAVQEAILKAFSKLGTLKEPQFFKTWVCRILIHECYKIANSRKRVVAYDEYISCNNNAMYEDINIGLYDAIMRLDSKRRIVVALHYVEGFSVSEVARMLKIPQGTVKSRLSKARTELKLFLEEEEESSYEKHEKTSQRIPGTA